MNQFLEAFLHTAVDTTNGRQKSLFLALANDEIGGQCILHATRLK